MKITGEKQNPKGSFRKDKTIQDSLQEDTEREGMTKSEETEGEEKQTAEYQKTGRSGTAN